MKRKAAFFFPLVFFFLFSPSRLRAQTSASDPAMKSTQFNTTGFPRWAKDLRRGEIIAFGSFPFTYFFSTFGFDLYRMSNNSWDMRYAPWPLKPAGAIEPTKDEKIMTLGIAAGGAIVIALVDYGITRYKRNRLERENRSLPEGTPIIIRKPLYTEEDDVPVLFPEIESP
jgi:hypothetical protein